MPAKLIARNGAGAAIPLIETNTRPSFRYTRAHVRLLYHRFAAAEKYCRSGWQKPQQASWAHPLPTWIADSTNHWYSSSYQ